MGFIAKFLQRDGFDPSESINVLKVDDKSLQNVHIRFNKVHTLWEGHKSWQNQPFFVHYLLTSTLSKSVAEKLCSDVSALVVLESSGFDLDLDLNV